MFRVFAGKAKRPNLAGKMVLASLHPCIFSVVMISASAFNAAREDFILFIIWEMLYPHLPDSSMAQEMSSSQTWRPRPSNISTSRQQQEPLPPPPPPPPQVRQHQHLQEQQLPLHPLLANLPTSSGASGGPSLPPNLQASMNDMAAPTSSAVDSAMATFARLAAEGSDQQEASASMDPLMVSEVQEKLRYALLKSYSVNMSKVPN